MLQKYQPKAFEQIVKVIKSEPVDSDQSRPVTPNNDENDVDEKKVVDCKDETPTNNCEATEEKQNSLCLSNLSDINLAQQDSTSSVVKTCDGESGGKKGTPLDELIKAASLLNPRQFELPREMSVHIPFPGTDKSRFFSFIR